MSCQQAAAAQGAELLSTSPKRPSLSTRSSSSAWRRVKWLTTDYSYYGTPSDSKQKIISLQMF